MNTFEQTVEEYKEEAMLSQDDMTMEEFYSLELELDDITTELYKESNNLEAVNFLEDDISFKALAIANGVSVAIVKDFTVESSKDSVVKKLWEKLKLLIKKAKLFITKWVSKALIMFMKDDDKRKELAAKLDAKTEDEFNLTKIPKSLLSKLKNYVKKGNNEASSDTVMSFLTFVKTNFDGNIEDACSELSRISNKRFPCKDHKEIVSIEPTSGGRYIIIRKVIKVDEKGKDVESTSIETFTLNKDDIAFLTSSFTNLNGKEAPTIEKLNLDKDKVFEELNKSKKDLQKEINEAYDKFKKAGEVEGDGNVKDITNSAKSISSGIGWVKGIIRRAKDAVVVAKAVVSTESIDVSIPEDIQTMIDNEDYSALRKASLDSKLSPEVIVEIVEELDAYGEMDDKHFKPDEQYARDAELIKHFSLKLKDDSKDVAKLYLKKILKWVGREEYNNSGMLTTILKDALSGKVQTQKTEDIGSIYDEKSEANYKGFKKYLNMGKELNSKELFSTIPEDATNYEGLEDEKMKEALLSESYSLNSLSSNLFIYGKGLKFSDEERVKITMNMLKRLETPLKSYEGYLGGVETISVKIVRNIETFIKVKEFKGSDKVLDKIKEIKEILSNKAEGAY